MVSRILNIAWKDVLHLWHNRLLLILAIFGAASELLLIGWATGSKVDDLKLAVVDHDQTETSRALIERLDQTAALNLDDDASATVEKDLERDGRQTALDNLFTRGNFIFSPSAVLLVEIPVGFEGDLLAGDQPEIALTINGANTLPGTTARRAAEEEIYTFGTVTLAQQQAMTGDAPISTAGLQTVEQVVRQQIAASQPPVTVRYNEKLDRAHYTTPSEAAFVLYIMAIMIAAFMLARERELGTFEQLLVMPVRPLEIIAGKAIPAMAVGYANFLLVLGIMNVAFGIPVRGSLALLLILAVSYLLVELGRGFFVAMIARTQNQALLIIMLIAFVDITFSGYAVPVESMPPLMQALSNLFPIRHWMIILRGILQKDVGIAVLWPQIVWLAVLGVLINSGTLWFFRRSLSEQR
jgi:ABC-2 type transport system permease protein